MADIYTTITTTTDILGQPEQAEIISKNDSQLLFGETFSVQDQNGEWLYGHSLIDGYEGYIHESQIAPQKHEPTHFINRISTLLYAAPDFKTRPVMSLSMLSRITLNDKRQDGFRETENGLWVYEDHCEPVIEMHNKAPLETAMQFLGTPYLYGGRCSLGIDCSGLTQIALLRAGHKNVPRDSGPQSQNGTEIPRGQHKAGDLIFFPGHVGIFTDSEHVLNATARTMDTRIEPLDKLKQDYKEITTIRRH